MHYILRFSKGWCCIMGGATRLAPLVRHAMPPRHAALLTVRLQATARLNVSEHLTLVARIRKGSATKPVGCKLDCNDGTPSLR